MEVDFYDSNRDQYLIASAFNNKFGDRYGKIKLNIEELPRSGRTGSKVFIVDGMGDGMPIYDHVAKIHNQDRIDEEYKRYEKYIEPQHIASNRINKGPSYQGKGVILGEYILSQTDNDELPSQIKGTNKRRFTTFEEILERADIDLRTKESILRRIFMEILQGANRSSRSLRCNILSHYRGENGKDIWGIPLPNYLEREKFTLKDLGRWLYPKERNMTFFDEDIFDLIQFMHHFPPFTARTKLVVKNLHGDLHPKNVYVSKMFLPSLFDFRWAHRGHALKDYVLMETSLFLFTLPRFRTPIEDITKVITTAVEDFNEPKDPKLPPYLLSILTLIKVIREEAKKYCIWKSEEAEYFSSLFLVTLGLIQYKDSNAIPAIYLCLKLAKRLESIYHNSKSSFEPKDNTAFAEEIRKDQELTETPSIENHQAHLHLDFQNDRFEARGFDGTTKKWWFLFKKAECKNTRVRSTGSCN